MAWVGELRAWCDTCTSYCFVSQWLMVRWLRRHARRRQRVLTSQLSAAARCSIHPSPLSHTSCSHSRCRVQLRPEVTPSGRPGRAVLTTYVQPIQTPSDMLAIIRWFRYTNSAFSWTDPTPIPVNEVDSVACSFFGVYTVLRVVVNCETWETARLDQTVVASFSSQKVIDMPTNFILLFIVTWINAQRKSERVDTATCFVLYLYGFFFALTSLQQ